MQEVQGRNCLTDFHGMGLTRDKTAMLVKKWHTMIEAHCKVKTTDGYIIRIFCIGFTKRRPEQSCCAENKDLDRVKGLGALALALAGSFGCFPRRSLLSSLSGTAAAAGSYMILRACLS